VHAAGDVESVLRLRRVLFEAAQINRLNAEEKLIAHLRNKNIIWKKIDEKPVFAELNALIREKGIDATPTCVIRYSASETKKYVGTDEVKKALSDLKTRLK